jgi:hypothetical protein
MSNAQRKATKQYRERRRRSGLKRLEVQVPADEVAVIRKAAAILRDHAEDASRLRIHLGFDPTLGSHASALDIFAAPEPFSEQADLLWNDAMARVARDRKDKKHNRARDVDL